MQYLLKETITSHASRSTVYGLKYEQVTVIRKSYHVCIVEDNKGKRFPVRDELLLEVTPEISPHVFKMVAELRQLQQNTTPLGVKKIKIQEEKINTILCQLTKQF